MNSGFMQIFLISCVLLLVVKYYPLQYIQAKAKRDLQQPLDIFLGKEQIWNKTTANNIINLYIHKRKAGLSATDIALKVFKAGDRLPNFKKYRRQLCYPFVCDSCFRAYADVIVETSGVTSKKLPSQMSSGDVVYVDVICHNDKNFTAFRKVLPDIKVPFVLIMGKCDPMMPHFEGGWTEVLGNALLIKWYVINPSPFFYHHPKVAGLPRGIDNVKNLNDLDTILMRGPLNPAYSKSLPTQEHMKRPILIYMNYAIDKTSRPLLTKLFEDIGTMEQNSGNISSYLEDVTKSKFVLSPKGYGMDCFRTYEAILLQAVPIVQDLSTELTDIIKLAPSFVLPKKWKEFVPNRTTFETFVPDEAMGRSVVLADYWFDKIDRARKGFSLKQSKL